MIKDYQVTLYCNNGKYRPVSCIIKCEESAPKMEKIKKGMEKICIKRYWNGSKDLNKYGYTKAKIRECGGAS